MKILILVAGLFLALSVACGVETTANPEPTQSHDDMLWEICVEFVAGVQKLKAAGYSDAEIIRMLNDGSSRSKVDYLISTCLASSERRK